MVLLACTLFGLATMHTLGHAGMRMPTADHHAVEAVEAITAVTAVTAVSAVSAAHGDCDGGCAHAPGSSPPGGMAGWAVCVAVLGAVLVIFLLALVLVRSRRRGPFAWRISRGDAGSRGPPVRRVGLALAAGSVLRI
ncbi:DUF6153 family protein [Actinoplanes sp. NPDC049599]|uniref:DUF6153 family protein n=1 Tax=Actinoplanes sp. NPDC049599 TaxID=3363903 RepID=UPI0037B3AD78